MVYLKQVCGEVTGYLSSSDKIWVKCLVQFFFFFFFFFEQVSCFGLALVDVVIIIHGNFHRGLKQ